MKISVITVSYNSAATIVDTVESVIGQEGVDVEYLVIDGGSFRILRYFLGKTKGVVPEWR